MRVLSLGTLTVFVWMGASVARADTIDDFVLTGNNQVITFSLPSLLNAINTPVVASVSATTVGTVNGVGGATISATFFTPAFMLEEGLQLSVNGEPVGVGPNGLLNGPDVVAFVLDPPPNANGQNPLEFLPGMYTESSPPNAFYPNYQPFTLTITPEAAPVPEPGSLLLLGTGYVCLAGGYVGRGKVSSAMR